MPTPIYVRPNGDIVSQETDVAEFYRKAIKWRMPQITIAKPRTEQPAVLVLQVEKAIVCTYGDGTVKTKESELRPAISIIPETRLDMTAVDMNGDARSLGYMIHLFSAFCTKLLDENWDQVTADEHGVPAVRPVAPE